MSRGMLEGSTAIVTGGNTGIGRAIALAFAREGAKLVIASRHETHREGLMPTHLVIQSSGGEAIFVPTDVSKAADVEALFSTTLERFGRLDVLVNNAGIVALGSVGDTSLEDWNRVMAVDLAAVFLVSKLAVEQMLRQGTGGNIINIASEDGYVYPVPGAVAYSVAKAGVIFLTRQMALDYGGKDIRVNVVCPGATDTPMTRYDTVGNVEAIVKAAATMGRIGQPEEIAEAVLFLASERASYITGHNLNVDGGWACL
ncbi:MAG: SDR family oxidoreductase [Candidatus Eiseniibacteriota bacterium]|nr:MAG: SDR family oxidoreductase [Candidatus Eisenbacteria bacterium]